MLLLIELGLYSENPLFFGGVPYLSGSIQVLPPSGFSIGTPTYLGMG